MSTNKNSSPLSESASASPFWQYLQTQETAFFSQKLTGIPCTTVLQIGLSQWRLADRLPRSTQAIYQNSLPNGKPDVCAHATALPWQTHSIDVVCLPHGMDNQTHVSEILQEIYRILPPGGHLLLTGLNPLGYWRFNQSALEFSGCLKKRFRIANTPTGKLYRAQTARQLLAATGFTVTEGQFMAYAPPFLKQPFQQKWELAGNRWWPHLGAVYGLVAVKRSVTLIPDESLVKKLASDWELQLTTAGRFRQPGTQNTQ
ncbi:class I SAM-dependent methyltransferase [Stenoxybacter acetivorans]|uniref:class I SAM-dependent methyltransferase n=1 Tax=Stenoxybacter acetivorans TaxID=422441 RepID=UPI0005671491|nr:methyltransferase domain-containing protein [Stenoxybacter acetivorans]